MRIEIQRIQSRFVQTVMIVGQDGNTSWLDIEMRAKAEIELDPSRDEDAVEMAMSHDHNVSTALSFFQPRLMLRLDLLDHSIHSGFHLLHTLPSRTPILPNRPVRIPLFDLGRLQPFILAIIPFPNFFGDDVVGQLVEVAKQEMERVVGALSR